MRLSVRKLLVTSLLCTTAAVPAAFAQQNQDAGARDQTALQGCENLAAITDENANRFDEEWIGDANAVVRRGDDERCDAWAQQAEIAIERAGQDRQTAGEGQAAGAGQDQQNAQAEDGTRILVEQPEPRVTVEQDSPEITVDQAQPRVRVSQGQPEIVVRQQQPTVRVEMPRPVITIDQPEPVIIVRMPEPDVNVAMPEPDIQVSQDEPRVRVQQGEPQVRVELDEPEVAVQGQREAEVQIEGGQPVVRQGGQQEQAQVQIERGQPRVSYERAEPRVEFGEQGEPEVRFTQSGEPEVRVERMQEQARAGDVARQNGEAAGDSEGPQELTGAREQNVENRMAAESGVQAADGESMGNNQIAALRENGQPTEAGDPSRVNVSEIVGRDVVNANGVELGTVERVVRNGQRHYVVLERGGFLGLGDRDVALPLDRISMQGNGEDLLMRGMTQQDIESMPSFDINSVQPIADGQQVPVREL